MAHLDGLGFCDFARYKQAYCERLKTHQLSDGEILSIYLRLKQQEEAITNPVQVKFHNTSDKLGSLALIISILDEDLKHTGITNAGYMVDGVWNSKKPFGLITDPNGKPTELVNGVFRPYDDGVDMSVFEKELVGVGANTALDATSRTL